MTEKTKPHEKTDPIAELLPWFVMGTLSDSDRKAVEHHLPACEDCQNELKHVQQLKNGLQNCYAALSDPSHEGYARIRGGIQEEEVSSQPNEEHSRVSEKRSWLSCVEQGVRSFFNIKWVPAVVAVLLISQTTFLMWEGMKDQQGGVSEMPDIITGPVTERDIPSLASPSSFSVIMKLAFQENISEQELRSVILGLGGRIIDGPSVKGVYVVEATMTDADTFDKKVEALRRQADIVRLVEQLDP